MKDKTRIRLAWLFVAIVILTSPFGAYGFDWNFRWFWPPPGFFGPLPLPIPIPY